MRPWCRCRNVKCSHSVPVPHLAILMASQRLFAMRQRALIKLFTVDLARDEKCLARKYTDWLTTGQMRWTLGVAGAYQRVDGWS